MWLSLAAVLTQATDPAGAAYIPPALVAERSACRERAGTVVDTSERDWYERQWRAAGEPSLAARGGEALRFTWLRSFDPPVFVRVEGLGGHRPRLIARELTGRGGYGPGSLKRQVDRQLTLSEAATLRQTLSRTRLLAATPVECDRMGMDGAQWIMEARGGGGYRLIVRWSPDAGPMRDMGLALLALTGWPVDPIY